MFFTRMKGVCAFAIRSELYEYRNAVSRPSTRRFVFVDIGIFACLCLEYHHCLFGAMLLSDYSLHLIAANGARF